MVVNSEQLAELFARLGVSDYEGRVYAALLAANPATAYEAAKEAGVPTSKVYEVIARLEARGMVRSLDEGGRKRYLPQSPDDFVETTRRSLGRTLDALKTDLSRLGGPQDQSYVWNLDPSDLLDKACRMIETAAEAVLVSAWNPEARVLAPLVAEARRRGVKTAVVHFGNGDLDLAGVFRHPIEDTLYAEKGGRGLTVVADGREALMGTLRGEGAEGGEGAWSRNHAFVTLAEDYVKHDIYIMKIVERFDPELQRRFGPKYEKLRDVWNDEEERK